MTRLPPPWTWLITKNSTPTISRIGSRLMRIDSQVFSFATWVRKESLEPDFSDAFDSVL